MQEKKSLRQKQRSLFSWNRVVKEFHSATHYTLSYCRHRFRGLAATRRRRELTLSDPVWCRGSILLYGIVWRWETQYEMMLEESSHCSNVRTYRQDATKLHVEKSTFFLRCTLVRTLFYFTTVIYEL